MLAIRLPIELEQRLNELAKITGRSKTFYTREALSKYIEDMEDIYLAEQTLISIRKGESRTYSLEEVKRDLKLED
jgi:RHH-type rel operon transcriptional repressor/antitoxin RelB